MLSYRQIQLIKRIAQPQDRRPLPEFAPLFNLRSLIDLQLVAGYSARNCFIVDQTMDNLLDGK